MVNRIIKEIQICLEQENYIAALTMALTLPDICGKAAEPSLGNGVNYKKWYKQYVAINNNKPISLSLHRQAVLSPYTLAILLIFWHLFKYNICNLFPVNVLIVCDYFTIASSISKGIIFKSYFKY